MKTLTTITIAVVLIGALSIGAYAYYGPRGGMSGAQNQMSGPRGPMMGGYYGAQSGAYGPRSKMMGRGHGGMFGRGFGYQEQMNPETCPCGAYESRSMGRPGWSAPGQQPQTVTEMITEEKAKEAAETYISTYLEGYAIEKIEKDDWRPMYFVTIKGAEGAEQIMTIHGFSGQVMHVFPKVVEEEAAEE